MIPKVQGGSATPARTIRLAAVLLLTLAALACGGSSESPDADGACESRPVRMAVASSLREIATGLATDFESAEPAVPIETSFGASSALARQLRHGAPIDVLVLADGELADAMASEGLLDPSSRVDVARGRLVLVARADREWADSGLAALDSRAAHRIALPVRAVPLGRYAHAWLEGRDQLEALDGRVVHTEDARATLTAVDQGHVDLAFVYASDARLGAQTRVLADLDPSGHPPIRYVAARTTHASDCPSVLRVLAAWSDSRTRVRLREAGFETIVRAAPARATEARE